MQEIYWGLEMRNKMIPEYYQHEAERCDNGVLIKGLRASERYIKPNNYGIVYRNKKGIEAEMHCKVVEVKPETVRRVAVKPINVYNDYEKRERHKCPNCKRYIPTGVFNCNHNNCGMVLDWS